MIVLFRSVMLKMELKMKNRYLNMGSQIQEEEEEEGFSDQKRMDG